MWNRPEVDFVQTQLLSWEYIPEGQFCGGGIRKVLSSARDSGAATWICETRNVTSGILPDGADLVLLEGTGTLNGIELVPNAYFYVPPGAHVEIQPGPLRPRLYVGFLGDSALRPGTSSADVEMTSNEEAGWAPANWSDEGSLSFGAFVKVLRKSDDCYVYFASMLPGWHTDQEEMHPVYEESFRLHGDLMQGQRGVMTPGAYSFRAPGVWHGPLYTRGGTLSIIRSSDITTTEYRDISFGSFEGCVATSYSGYSHPATVS